MNKTNIEIKTVSELLNKKFFIPSYQRGYRWTKQQVEDLLNDIDSFMPKEVQTSNKKTWYCLQPLVVKKRSDNEWEVIDGQQRLTTIFLILYYFNQGYVEERRKKLFELDYETRKKSNVFLQKINEQSDGNVDSNIDYQHIFNAYQVINKWFKEKGDQYNQNEFESKFQQYTKVIWYETDPSQDGRDIFSRINIGKIPLTNAELIKALFLNSSNFKTDNNNDKERIRLKQLEIATEWDIIEADLHNEEFWFFINKEENEKETRIEFLFELIVGKPDKSEDRYYTFRMYSQKFTNNTEQIITENWEQVKFYFQTLKDWFNDRELYHKIGFLVTVGENIKDLIDDKLKSSTTKFRIRVNEKIKEKFAKINIDELEKKDDAKVRMVLLLHNIQTMLNNKAENTRFPFNRYKKKTKENKGWDVEHIHAIATEMPEKKDQQEDWLKYAKEIIASKLELEKNELSSDKHSNEESQQNVISRLESLLNEQYDSENFKDQFNRISICIGDEDINDLSNLALLDLGTNRSYKNEFFSSKRKIIIEKDKTNTFIPICTKNAFMKYYSPKIDQMTFWSESDRDAYLQDIKNVLKDYLSTSKED